MRRALSSISILVLFASGCGQPESPAPEQELSIAPEPSVETPVATDDSAILERPFTAEQIRDEWVPGFRLLLSRTTAEGTIVEKWTVVAADDEGVDIESVNLANDLTAEGEASVNHSSWIELRDHASFPAASSTREWVTRPTQLGELDGWLYREVDEENGSTKELFFAASLPGAPVQMKIFQGDAVVFELEQTARLRPATE